VNPLKVTVLLPCDAPYFDIDWAEEFPMPHEYTIGSPQEEFVYELTLDPAYDHCTLIVELYKYDQLKYDWESLPPQNEYLSLEDTLPEGKVLLYSTDTSLDSGADLFKLVATTTAASAHREELLLDVSWLSACRIATFDNPIIEEMESYVGNENVK